MIQRFMEMLMTISMLGMGSRVMLQRELSQNMTPDQRRCLVDKAREFYSSSRIPPTHARIVDFARKYARNELSVHLTFIDADDIVADAIRESCKVTGPAKFRHGDTVRVVGNPVVVGSRVAGCEGIVDACGEHRYGGWIYLIEFDRPLRYNWITEKYLVRAEE